MGGKSPDSDTALKEQVSNVTSRVAEGTCNNVDPIAMGHRRRHPVTNSTAQPGWLALKVLVEQFERTFPGVTRINSAIDVRTRVVEEAVRATGVDSDFTRLVEFAERAGQPIDILALNPSVIFAISIEDGTLEILQLFVRRNLPIKGGRGLDVTGDAWKRHRITAAHA